MSASDQTCRQQYIVITAKGDFGITRIELVRFIRPLFMLTPQRDLNS